MSLRTPSKIISTTYYSPYIIRYVVHGAAIKYSSIVKNLNSKSLDTSLMAIPLGFTSITHIGFTNYHDLVNYPNINKGSMFQLIDSLPAPLVEQMRKRGKIIQDENVINKEGVVLTMFVYELGYHEA